MKLSNSDCELVEQWIKLKDEKCNQHPNYVRWCKSLAEAYPEHVRETVFTKFRQDIAEESVRRLAPAVYEDLLNGRI